jgi:hypothetical protein
MTPCATRQAIATCVAVAPYALPNSLSPAANLLFLMFRSGEKLHHASLTTSLSYISQVIKYFSDCRPWDVDYISNWALTSLRPRPTARPQDRKTTRHRNKQRPVLGIAIIASILARIYPTSYPCPPTSIPAPSATFADLFLLRSVQIVLPFLRIGLLFSAIWVIMRSRRDTLLLLPLLHTRFLLLNLKSMVLLSGLRVSFSLTSRLVSYLCVWLVVEPFGALNPTIRRIPSTGSPCHGIQHNDDMHDQRIIFNIILLFFPS